MLRRIFGLGEPLQRPGFDTGRWTPELLRRLEWRRFEELCAAYYEASGFAVAADMSLCAPGAGRASLLLRCEPWNAYRIGARPVRELRARMSSRHVAEGVLVTSGKFTPDARALAARERISLVDGAELLGKIGALAPEKALALLALATRGDFQTPTCPACALKMIRRRSTARGRTFWGCPNYPGCKQTFFDAA